MNELGLALENRTVARGWNLPALTLIGLIAKKEIVTNLLTFKIPAACLIMTALLLLSGYLLASDYRQRLNNWSINQTAQSNPVVGGIVRYDFPGGSFFHSAGVGHSPPMQRPSPMSSLVKGMDGEIDRSVSVRQQLTFGARQDIGDVLAISTPDTSFVIKLLISLFALLFSLNCVTREKEEGTLQALLAHSVRRGELILGKAIGVTVSLLAPFAVACLIEIVYLMTAHRMFGNKDEVSRTLLIFAMGALYGVVFVLSLIHI